MNNENRNIQSSLNSSAPIFQMPVYYETLVVCEGGENIFSSTTMGKELTTILLSTFICLIKDESNKCFEVRGLLDVGANSNFMSKRLADSLNLNRSSSNITVSGINNMFLSIKSKVNATILNRDKSFDLNLNFVVIPKITELTPANPLNVNILSLNNIYSESY